jgi:hypothetical protein
MLATMPTRVGPITVKNAKKSALSNEKRDIPL